MEVENTIKFFKEQVKRLDSKFHYSSILLVDNGEVRISVDKSGTDCGSTDDLGVKIRAFDGQKIIERCQSGVDEEVIIKQIDLLLEEPVFEKEFELDIENNNLSKRFTFEKENDFSKVSLNDKISKVKNVHDTFLEKEPSLANSRNVYLELSNKKIFVDRYRDLYQDVSNLLLLSVLFVNADDGNVRYHYESDMHSHYFLDELSDAYYNNAIEKAKRVLSAKKIKPGKYECVLSPKLSGLLAHESFGHGMEADTVFKDRAKASDYAGQKIAGDEISIIDEPNISGKNGEFCFDDEGKLSEKVYLIKNGVVSDYMTTLYDASRLGVKRSSNGRCESYDHKIYARMSNTYFASGTSNKDDMIASVKDGLYLSEAGGGMEDPKGWGVQVQDIVAQKIVDGKLVDEFYQGISLTGFLLDIMKNIVSVSKESYIKGAGSCGKGHKEWVPVSEGGSYLQIKELSLS